MSREDYETNPPYRRKESAPGAAQLDRPFADDTSPRKSTAMGILLERIERQLLLARESNQRLLKHRVALLGPFPQPKPQENKPSTDCLFGLVFEKLDALEHELTCIEESIASLNKEVA